MRYVVLFVLLGCLGGCPSGGLTQADVDAHVLLWKGTVDVLKEAGVDATVSLDVETQTGEVFQKMSFGFEPPFKVRLRVTSNVKPAK